MIVAGHFPEEQGVFQWISHKGEEQVTQFKVAGGGGVQEKNWSTQMLNFAVKCENEK